MNINRAKELPSETERLIERIAGEMDKLEEELARRQDTLATEEIRRKWRALLVRMQQIGLAADDTPQATKLNH